MNKQEEKFIKMLNEFKEEQKKAMEIQNKKHKISIIKVMALCLLFSGITSVASYSLAANNVAYTPTDSNWKVANTKEAIDDLFDSVGSALVGSVYSYMGTSAPSGYLACDGSTYKIVDYPRLSEHIQRHFGSYNFFGGDGETTFAVPDLRGEFLRGTGTNSHANEGSGASVGVHQSGTIHSYIGANNRSGNVTMGIRTLEDSGGFDAYHFDSRSNIRHSIGYAGMNSTSANNQELYTSRPTNTSVLYIIKY